MQTRSKESAPRSSTKRVSRPIAASLGVGTLERTISTSSASRVGSVIDRSPEDQGVVRTAKSEGRTDDDLQRSRTPLVGHVVEVELRVGDVMDRRRDDLALKRLDADGGLDGRRRAEAVAQGPLDRADGQPP